MTIESGIEVGDGETITESFTYDGDGLVETRTDARGQTTTFTWDATKGSLGSQTDPAGNTTTMTSDAVASYEAGALGADPPLRDATDQPWPPTNPVPPQNDCSAFLFEWGGEVVA